MAPTFQGGGGASNPDWGEFTADGSVGLGPSPQAGDRHFLFVHWKAFNTTLAVSGWTEVGTVFADGAVASGNGVGSVAAAVFYRDWQSGDGNPVLDWSVSPTQAGAHTQLWRKGASETWDTPLKVTAAWPATATTQTISASSSVAVPDGSVVIASIGLRDDSAVFTRAATTGIDVASGITWAANYVEAPSAHGNFTSGADGAYDAGYRLVTTGGSVTLRVTATISAVETGSIQWIVQGVTAAAARVPRSTPYPQLLSH
jgi:hypothetical protein